MSGSRALTRPVRVVIDPGSHQMLNMGDVAMTQVAVDRVHELWPDAVVHVLTASAERLAEYCPRARPLPAEGRYGWNGRVATRLAIRAQRALSRLDPIVSAYLDELADADLLLIAGRGGTTDAFGDESLAVLNEIETALSLGVPVAMTGQGVGPMREQGLVARAAAVLPRVSLIAAREDVCAGPLLESLGVPPDRVAITGDDALEPAFEQRPHTRAGGGIGVGLRFADYAGVGADLLDAIGRAMREAAGRLRTRIVPLPISHYPGEVDGERASTLAADLLAPAAGSSASDMDDALSRPGGCRVVVTGCYHAAVFALAQGVPSVAFWSSEYYATKFEGLRAQFAGRLRVVPAAGDAFEERLVRATEDAWHAPEHERTQLLDLALRQIAASRAAYARLPAIARRPARQAAKLAAARP